MGQIVMKKLFQKFDIIYQNRLFKDLYTYILSGMTAILIFLIPFFIPMRKLLGSFIFDLLVRIFVTFVFYRMFYFVSHLDQFYEKFYFGINSANTPKPDGIKQVVNICAALFVGCCGYLFFHSSVKYFLQMVEGWSVPISLGISILLSLPMLSQYKKR